MSMRRYTCRESAPMISASICSASSTASVVFPLAVGPTIVIRRLIALRLSHACVSYTPGSIFASTAHRSIEPCRWAAMVSAIRQVVAAVRRPPWLELHLGQQGVPGSANIHAYRLGVLVGLFGPLISRLS